MGLQTQEAIQRGHDGAEQAAQHAERVVENWLAQACAAVLSFGKWQVDPWLLESAREYAESTGLPAPPDKRAWGGVARRLLLGGHIASCGFGSANSSNGSPKVLWRIR